MLKFLFLLFSSPFRLLIFHSGSSSSTVSFFLDNLSSGGGKKSKLKLQIFVCLFEHSLFISQKFWNIRSQRILENRLFIFMCLVLKGMERLRAF